MPKPQKPGKASVSGYGLPQENIAMWDTVLRSDGRPRVAEHPKAATPRRPSNTGRNLRLEENREPIRPPRRKPNRKKKNTRPRYLLLAGLAIFMGLVTWALTDPRLDVRHVSVRGAQTISADEVASLVPIPAHRNIFLYFVTHRHALAERIEKAEPVVQSVRMGIHLPNTLTATLAERQPYALLRQADSGFWVLDSQGVPFRQIQSRPQGLPCMTMPSNSLSPQLGHPLSLDSATPVGAFYLALKLLSTQRMAILSKIREITVDQNANLCLNMSNNLQIRLGQPDDLAQKLDIAATALSSDNSLLERAQYLDVTYPQRPAWKPRGPVVPATPLPRDNAD